MQDKQFGTVGNVWVLGMYVLCVSVRACVRACARARVCVCVCVCVCVLFFNSSAC